MHSDTQLDMVTVVNFSQADAYCHYVIHVGWYTTQDVLYSECPLSDMYINAGVQVYTLYVGISLLENCIIPHIWVCVLSHC